MIHGAVEPSRALVTVGDSVQLEALVRPGEIVGGDPLFDLAHGLLPRHPASFRQGLIEGYGASGALAPEQEDRLRRLRLLLTSPIRSGGTMRTGPRGCCVRLPIYCKRLGLNVQEQ